MHCDKHVVKMLVEYAQILSTAHRMVDGEKYIGKSKLGRKVTRYRLPDNLENIVYKVPVISIIRLLFGIVLLVSIIQWLFNLWCELAREYRHRYGN